MENLWRQVASNSLEWKLFLWTAGVHNGGGSRPLSQKCGPMDGKGENPIEIQLSQLWLIDLIHSWRVRKIQGHCLVIPHVAIVSSTISPTGLRDGYGSFYSGTLYDPTIVTIGTCRWSYKPQICCPSICIIGFDLFWPNHVLGWSKSVSLTSPNHRECDRIQLGQDTSCPVSPNPKGLQITQRGAPQDKEWITLLCKPIKDGKGISTRKPNKHANIMPTLRQPIKVFRYLLVLTHITSFLHIKQPPFYGPKNLMSSPPFKALAALDKGFSWSAVEACTYYTQI